MRSRVITSYKAWCRRIPSSDYDIPKTVPECPAKLRELFEKNENVTDIGEIGLLVINGQMELQETDGIWKQKGHIMTITLKKVKNLHQLIS